jgi:putative RNA 2'-phosphotransferase
MQHGAVRVARDDIRKSKLLSLVLRHSPEAVGIELDEAGWTSVPSLLQALADFGEPLSMNELERVVAASDKQRFAFNADRSRIRANHGHSVPVDPGLAPAVPPDTLYHGTPTRFVKSIMRDGVLKQRRRYVHLHADPKIAAIVGKRRGDAVVLSVDAAAMHRSGFRFYNTANNIWLTETVPPAYIRSDAVDPPGGA